MIRQLSRPLMLVIGLAWSVSAAQATVLTVGGSGDYADFGSALAAAGTGDTIRFLESTTYTTNNSHDIHDAGLIIESAPGQWATLSFTGNPLAPHGLNLAAPNVTIRNITLRHDRGGRIVTVDPAQASDATISHVNFIAAANSTNLLETADGMSISYSTFIGTGANDSGGIGISWSDNTSITVDHSSFDQLRVPIYNPGAPTTTTHLDVTNSAFGQWSDASSFRGGINVNGSISTAYEDYNAVYGPLPFIRSGDASKVTSGGNTFTVGSYGLIFTGDTSSGDWAVEAALHTAASDGTTIGAWQAPIPEPASFVLLALGGMAGFSRRRLAR